MGAGVNRAVHVPTPSPACTLARARRNAPAKPLILPVTLHVCHVLLV